MFKKTLIGYMALLVAVALYVYLNPIQSKVQSIFNELEMINLETHNELHQLIKTKYFKMIRMNLNQECPLYARNFICKSQSCTVCRCDEKDIPKSWIRKDNITDRVKHVQGGKVDIWEKERNQQSSANPNQNRQEGGQNHDQMKGQSSEDIATSESVKDFTWQWHVEDEQNDQGEYFDLDQNIESFTNYNGSTIWRMVYEENCFSGSHNYDQMCKEEEVFYKVISGLHTSISTHLSRFYKNITAQHNQMWADLRNSEQFYENLAEYKRRVLDHPQRVKNLLFIYQIYLRAIKKISDDMVLTNYTVQSDNIVQDLLATQLLQNLSKKFDDYQFEPFDRQIKTFFYAENPKVRLYQKYIHNISRIMNCVECEKCRLYGKMQTYGIGTALKILLGYDHFYKRNEMVALFNAWNKISMSVEFYFKVVNSLESTQNIADQMNSVSNTQNLKTKQKFDIFWIQLAAFTGGIFVVFILLIQQINMKQKVKKLFKHVRLPDQESQVYKSGQESAQGAQKQKFS